MTYASARCRLAGGAGSSSSTWTLNASRSSPILGAVPEIFASYRFEDLRFRSYRTILFQCNWKTAVDSFNEGYHAQGLHPQMLSWYDDTRFLYAPVGRHSLYGEQQYRRELGPSPRLGLDPEDFDEAELLADRIDAVSGLFSRSDRRLLEELQNEGPPEGKTAVEVFNELRVKAIRDRGDLSGLTDDQILRNGTIHLFPNLLGPIVHGNATLYRSRPNGLDPDSTLLDYWALEWVPSGQRCSIGRTQVLRGLGDKGLGPHQQSGLRQPGRDRQGPEVTVAIAGPCSIPSKRPTSSITTRSLTSTSPSRGAGQGSEDHRRRPHGGPLDALAAVRVLDLSDGIAGAYCAKLLADAGAQVVKLEPPTGHPLRKWSVSGAVGSDGETDGALFRHLAAGQRSVVADIDDPRGGGPDAGAGRRQRHRDRELRSALPRGPRPRPRATS